MKRPDPNLDTDLGGLEPHEAQRSLGADLAETVDGARQIVADMGLRPYRVFSVVERWDSGVVGRGRVTRTSELEIVPPPKVDFQPLRRNYKAAGSVERGEIVVRKISARYTEDQIFSLLRPVITKGEAAYIEIRQDGRGGDQPKRRRFTVAAVPSLDAERFEWVVRLRPQDNARDRRGRPSG